MTRYYLILMIVCIVTSAEFLTGNFNVEHGKAIAKTPSTTKSILARSRLDCFGECFKTIECNVCSFNDSTEMCDIDLSSSVNVQTLSAPNSVTATRNFEALKDCCDLPPTSTSGVYRLKLTPDNIFDVYCDMHTDGGGWTVFQRRLDGSTDFRQDWSAYGGGFGDLNKEFWLGNDKIYEITSGGLHKLRVDLEDFDGNTTFALYSSFKVSNSSSNYTLDVSGYNGTAGDALIYHDRMEFSTYDQDHDEIVSNCAEDWRGGWWFRSCFRSNLNGVYFNTTDRNNGVYWLPWRSYTSLKFSRMMVKRHSCPKH